MASLGNYMGSQQRRGNPKEPPPQSPLYQPPGAYMEKLNKQGSPLLITRHTHPPRPPPSIASLWEKRASIMQRYYPKPPYPRDLGTPIRNYLYSILPLENLDVELTLEAKNNPDRFY